MRIARWLIVLVLLGTAGCGASRFNSTLAGDEAPIRVKSGSIDLDLLTAVQVWEPAGTADKKRWKISGGTRNQNEYLVIVLPSDVSKCKPFAVVSRTVQVIHGGATEAANNIEFRSTGNHTMVTSQQDLNASGRNLKYDPDDGFITEIRTDGGPSCTFDREDEDLVVALLDY
jgi:hypothetical protein